MVAHSRGRASAQREARKDYRTAMETQRYTIEVDAEEYDAIRHHRAAKARPRPEARPNAKANPFWVLLLLVIVAALLGRVALDYATAFGLFTPPGWAQQQPTAPALPTALVAAPAPRQQPVVVVPAPAAVEPAAPAPVVAAPVKSAPVNPDAQPDLIAVNADRAMGGTGDTAPLPAVLPTVVPNVPVAPYDANDPVAAETYKRAMQNSGIDVDATATVMAEIACNADLAAGGAGCP